MANYEEYLENCVNALMTWIRPLSDCSPINTFFTHLWIDRIPVLSESMVLIGADVSVLESNQTS